MQFECPICRKVSRPSNWLIVPTAQEAVCYPHAVCIGQLLDALRKLRQDQTITERQREATNELSAKLREEWGEAPSYKTRLDTMPSLEDWKIQFPQPSKKDLDRQARAQAKVDAEFKGVQAMDIEHCDLCGYPVKGSVHCELVSGKHRCFRCMRYGDMGTVRFRSESSHTQTGCDNASNREQITATLAETCGSYACQHEFPHSHDKDGKTVPQAVPVSDFPLPGSVPRWPK